MGGCLFGANVIDAFLTRRPWIYRTPLEEPFASPNVHLPNFLPTHQNHANHKKFQSRRTSGHCIYLFWSSHPPDTVVSLCLPQELLAVFSITKIINGHFWNIKIFLSKIFIFFFFLPNISSNQMYWFPSFSQVLLSVWFCRWTNCMRAFVYRGGCKRARVKWNKLLLPRLLLKAHEKAWPRSIAATRSTQRSVLTHLLAETFLLRFFMSQIFSYLEHGYFWGGVGKSVGRISH